MSTEQHHDLPKDHHKETHKEHVKELEQNVLKEKLTTGWEKFKAGKLVSYRTMAITLILVTAAGLFFYIRSGKRAENSATWVAVETASTLDALNDIAAKNPNSKAAHLATLHAARYKLGAIGIDELTTRDLGKQKKAVENIEAARDSFAQLVDTFKDDPVLQVESILGRAKAEAALIGISKDGATGDYRGNVKTLIEWLEKLATAADGTPWGEDAKKYAESLKNPETAKELVNVQRSLYQIDTLPKLPDGFGPKSPLDTGSLPFLPGGGAGLGPLSPGDKPKEPEKAKEPEKGKEPEKKADAKKEPEKKEPEKKDAAPPKPPEPAPKPPEKK